MADDYELLGVDFITIDTIGPPGKRVFHMQAQRDETLFTFTIEKFQAEAIADGLLALFSTVQKEIGPETPEVDLRDFDLALREPVVPLFRIGKIGLGYDENDDTVILVMGELVEEEDEDLARIVRLSGTRDQMRALAQYAQVVVAQGRPICPHCGEPINPDGHFCPKRNGHRKPVSWA